MVEKYFDINREGHSIKCKLYCKDIHTIDTAILTCHGFGGHKDNKINARFAEHVIAKHKTAAILTFDLPCHGEDVKKRLTLNDCDTYITFALDYLKERFNITRFYAYATSFSGYLILKYIQEHDNPFIKIALRSTSIQMYNVMLSDVVSKEDLVMLSKGKDISIGRDKKLKVNQAFIDDLQANDISKLDYIDYADSILLIHGTKDEAISLQQVIDFSENNVIELIIVEKADHRFQEIKLLDYAISCIIKFFEL